MARKLVIDINYPSQPPDKPDTKTKMRPTVAEANRLLEHGTLGDAKVADAGVPGMKKGVHKATGPKPGSVVNHTYTHPTQGAGYIAQRFKGGMFPKNESIATTGPMFKRVVTRHPSIEEAHAKLTGMGYKRNE